MKKFKLLIAGIFTLMLWGSCSFGAYLYLAPDRGSLGKNCINTFNVWLEMNNSEIATAMDMRLDSNMEFIGFENGEVFDYSLPPVYDSTYGLEYITLIQSMGTNISKGGLVGKLYYKVVGDDDPYLHFDFNEVGDTTDTTLAYAGEDILTSVKGGDYTLSLEDMCEDDVELELSLNNDETMDEFMEKFQNGVDKMLLEDNKLWYDNYKNIIIIGCVLLLVIVILFFWKRKKHEKMS